MKTTIDEAGCLIITAETSLESYALTKWGQGYFVDDAVRISSIMLNTYSIKPKDLNPGQYRPQDDPR